ncbi:cysteine/1-D-myo-inosityl 2-amino-2-deoxy-alpha- D-glucopyranoside ligase [Cellulomonas flavigena DSM 20109]|uniref:L-cysteine:1D-myo-inositol 2-amino-2-deoxy-alpha-D-glucopyranoside ligase n=1 Tax=Cellulomonas flavigena (strain ATCC 482 / DSM 20109 / BCRC 11376 / JCM 18109 / NBRC 3775 / NCIMB 8073 / NRS 134) TaxID=446466 RepID=MSHC_CELFN|nr:cysteine--1-D-myo-inosityl 2-amino-2-deoxy-alpha-D-glucopyranoside ligase [Cellulomonas flavigena]D5UFA8.1 RecName: Full=L-cysteine:1D-myo-inositol 2-amino-2-deoxy-alpha-D-glucopyranoside ligase; Short=L-Cys:GlcN-Ins ligase; AltName: Full=Mycothiol ligase; Short=MSH ligase [Cellulomonas flavigena DSM 20109]ADG74905.1 cysteine/1-D-myo-inosityl 2-amino-2-deoxy-alpha- D-glucopyranoside ligase [Cellulomonas flavigena DSM 20109]
MLSWPAPQIPRLPGTGEPVRVLDTATGRLVVAATGPHARLYVCGITPYDATHLGHASTYVAFDVLVRAWLDEGKTVTYASNVTDVDDPLLERATATGVDWRDLAAQQTALYASDMTTLGVVPPDVYRGVVESVPQVVAAVDALLSRDAAYRLPAPDGGDDVYADLSADPGFGSVAGLEHAAMLALSAERGGDPDRPGKRSPLDPLLWRAERPGEPAWDAPGLGRGRPGWHVECAVIASDGLGVPFDVQGGGSDLAFPHHESSASHLRVLTGTPQPAAAHVHTGMVGYRGHKMSKSLGNLVLVSQLVADGVEPMAVRLAVLAHRYRSDWEWTDDVLATAQQRVARWRRALSGNGGPAAQPVLDGVRAAVADDLDTPRALAVVDAWATAALAGEVPFEEGAPGVVARTVDALLGVRM